MLLTRRDTVTGCSPMAKTGAQRVAEHRQRQKDRMRELEAEVAALRAIKHAGVCLHCRRKIVAYTSAEWSKIVKRPCPHCGRAGW